MTNNGPDPAALPPGWATKAFNALMRQWVWNAGGEFAHRWAIDVPVDGMYELTMPVSVVGTNGLGSTSTQLVHLTHGRNVLTVSPILRLVESDEDAEARKRREAETPYDPNSRAENDEPRDFDDCWKEWVQP